MNIFQRPAYSQIFSCLHDERNPELPSSFHYSVFRSYEYKDVCNKQVHTPLVHDFAVLWDDDHDARVITVAENIYLAGLLSPIQFIGEHKGHITIIFAAIARFGVQNFEMYQQAVERIATKAGDDYWYVKFGFFDKHDREFSSSHQTYLEGITGLSAAVEHTHLLSVDDRWKLGTKAFDERRLLKMHISE
jgi:hypothetical protein